MKLFTSLLFCLYVMILSAVPAKRERYTLHLADGTTVEATAMGDETMHFFQTDDGRHLQCDSLGIAHYVEIDNLLKHQKARSLKRQATLAKRFASRQRKSERSLIGSKPGLVILVQFPQTPFRYTNADFRRLFNEKGYTDNINIGSVRDYFLDASYRQFDFTFDVVGPVTVSQPLSFYGANNDNGDDQHPAVMVAEAVQLVNDKVDFKKYDWDGDGEVEQIFIIHSGFDEAQNTSQPNNIWSHAWTLTEALDENDGEGPIMADGVVIDSYATSAELHGNSNINAKIAGIGIACHEFSHCFGLPDFYNTQGYSSGMNSWDLMDFGEYNGNGGAPAGFTSYERMFCGWLQPTELVEPIVVQNMPALTSEPVAYILRNSGKADEYYLLENRQQEGWDSRLAGHGLLILHVDYDSQAWAENTVNIIPSHQRMTIIPADNTLYSSTLAGDPWPGTSGNTELSDTTTPVAKLFNKNAENDYLMHHSISEISESDDGLISFIFDEGTSGIMSPSTSAEEGFFYNLSGLKVSPDYKGIVIKNGKKTFIHNP